MTKVTITFTIQDEDYKTYDKAVDSFLCEISATDIDITEDEV
jgi:hypothetical protein